MKEYPGPLRLTERETIIARRPDGRALEIVTADDANFVGLGNARPAVLSGAYVARPLQCVCFQILIPRTVFIIRRRLALSRADRTGFRAGFFFAMHQLKHS